MGTHIEFITMEIGVLRCGLEFNSYGDPYEFSGTVILNGTIAKIIGASGKFSISFFYEIRSILRDKGIKKVEWERITKGVVKLVSINI